MLSCCFYLFLPQFIIIEFYIYKHVSHELEILEGSFEELGASINTSEVLKPAVLKMKELINVTQGTDVSFFRRQNACDIKSINCTYWLPEGQILFRLLGAEVDFNA